MYTCITSDIGGTNARFFLHEIYPESSQSQVLLTRIYVSNDYDSLEEVLELFLGEKECRRRFPKQLVLSIAGAPKNNEIESFSNIKWPGISGSKIANVFGFQKVALLNDFEAVGYSASTMDFENMYCLQNSVAPCPENYVIIGAGTGLGIVFVTKIGGRTVVVPSEGGHHYQGFASELEKDYQLYVIDKMDELYPEKQLQYADTEYLFCGLGLPIMYEFFHLRIKGVLPPKMLSGKEVVSTFTTSEVGEQCLKFYMSVLGRVINIITKMFLFNGGRLVLAGIIGKVLQNVFDGDEQKFWKMIKPFGNNDSLLPTFKQKIDVFVSTTDLSEHALEGCVNYLFQSQGSRLG